MRLTPRAFGGLVLAALAACQGQGSDAPKQPAGSATPPSTPTGAAGSSGSGAPVPSEGSGAAVPAAEPPRAKTATETIAALGAIPAWEGVVQRGQLLARRGQRGVLYGKVGPVVEGAGGEGELIWLIDDTDGEGSLAVRAKFPGAAPPAGSRITARGAWLLPETTGASIPGGASAVAPAAKRWIWQIEQSAALPDEPPGRVDPAAPPPSAIGHDPLAAPRPAGAVPISKAKDNDLVAFQVLAAPRRLGEAWLVGDQLGSPPVAMLSLPGDRPSYGGIDFRQPDEQWRLRRGVTYVVRIGKIRRKDPAKPATINARNAPIKVS